MDTLCIDVKQAELNLKNYKERLIIEKKLKLSIKENAKSNNIIIYHILDFFGLKKRFLVNDYILSLLDNALSTQRGI